MYVSIIIQLSGQKQSAESACTCSYFCMIGIARLVSIGSTALACNCMRPSEMMGDMTVCIISPTWFEI